MARTYVEKKKSNGGWLVFFSLLCIIIIGVGGYFLFQYFKDHYVPEEASKTIGELELEKAKLENELAAIKADNFRKTWAPVLIWVAVIAALAWIIVTIIKSNASRPKHVLTIDEAKKKGWTLVKDIIGLEPVWCMADATEKTVKGNKVYFLTYGFYPKKGDRPVNWSMTKILAIINDDWDHARIENIPSGFTMMEAFEHVMHEMDRFGYSVQKEPKTADMEALGEFMQKRKEGEKMFQGLGLESTEE